MKANELRIGNYILMDFFSDNTDDPHRVIAKDIANIVRFKNKIGGVPLTEDWLVKFGFVFMDDYWVISILDDSEICLSFWEEEGILSIDSYGIYKKQDNKENGGWFYPKQIEHVHQLQNLYFALTGDELTIKQ